MEEEELSSPFNHEAYAGDGPYPSWFWYGRYEGALGGYIPPQEQGALSQILYWLGNLVGRHFGPPRDRL